MLEPEEKRILKLEFRVKRIEQFVANLKNLGIAIISGFAILLISKLF